MIILGLLLLVVAVIFGLDLIWKNHFTIRSPALFGQTLGIHNAAEFFILGAITGASCSWGSPWCWPGCAVKAPRPSSTALSARKPRTPAMTVTRPGGTGPGPREENEKLHRRLDHDDIPTDASAGTHSSGATAAD